MNEFIDTHQQQLINSLICFIAFFIIRYLTAKAIHKIGRISDINRVRTKLIIRYITILFMAISFIVIVYIWQVNFEDLGIIFSSVFAVLGVALFASWSILSNITAGVILFFSFPFKIGDRIKILDGDFAEEVDILDIKAYHIYLKKDNGELLTYPNNLLLQKGVVLINRDDNDDTTEGDYI
ncbi:MULTISPECIES: mechanosensitive ion channel domain-containing protein [Cellulophaga]|uniref:Small-conductance mechanosensitive channel n=2 Tax=Cellulophaga TaxID=104264 RepID=F0RE16_CELLC|nr:MULTISPECIES: mechanosensitive ion channel domain-containing protein [Cellulophaga]ADY30971.1 small-conductance mechanosensitive channel [Cellulophaga lytica DSM 7489]AIM61942.1 mechanosensitive ion channel protein MscS [Cellulophaga lytica]APU11849.1 mechanosensitive ion channel protein MscS [Cellulophaga lytica]EWH13415.1 small-conductance mechanosensitive channel [Cellulophaga geojensis KL-A]MDO6852852.1 mechanosensitive ion channel [Cellulophaga lytica]